MKRYISMLLALLTVVSLCACGQKETVLTWQEQYDLGIHYLSEGNYEAAIIAFTAAIEIDPKRLDSYLGLADTYEVMGDTAGAAQVIEDAIAQLGELEELLARKRQERQGDEPGYMTLLMRQEYRWPQDPVTLTEERGVVTYRYDEYGYVLSWENSLYVRDRHIGEEYLSGTDYGAYSYDGGEAFEHCWWVHPDGRTEDKGTESLGQAMQGSWYGFTGFTGERGLCMDPHPGEGGAYWLCPSRVENEWINSDTDWAYADVTYDDRGYPIGYISYDSSGQVTGTAELHWETVPVLEEGEEN